MGGLPYQGGYRANIVTFGIAKIVFDLGRFDKVIDLDSIWKNQILTQQLEAALCEAGKIAQDIITFPPKGIQNASEWAKKDICWKWLTEKETMYMQKPDRISILRDEALGRAKDAKRSNEIDASIGIELEVFNLGANFWRKALAWGIQRNTVSPKERGILETCIMIPKKIPTEKQCIAALTILDRLKEAGFSA